MVINRAVISIPDGTDVRVELLAWPYKRLAHNIGILWLGHYSNMAK